MRRFYTLPRMLMLYGGLWAPIALVACALLTYRVLPGCAGTAADTDPMTRIAIWPFMVITFMTVMALLIIIWATAWTAAYARRTHRAYYAVHAGGAAEDQPRNATDAMLRELGVRDVEE